MKKNIPEDTLSNLQRENKIYRDRIHILEQRLAMRNAEAEAYGEEALFYHKKEVALLEKADRLQNEVYRYQNLYYDKVRELDIIGYYPKWVCWLFRKNATFNAS